MVAILWTLAVVRSEGARSGGWYQFETKALRLASEVGLQPAVTVCVSSGPQGVVVFDLPAHHDIEDGGNLVGGRRRRRGWSKAGLHTTQVVAERCWAAMPRVGSEAEDLAGTALQLSSASPQDRSTPDVVVRAQR